MSGIDIKPSQERRRRNLTQGDIDAIVSGLEQCIHSKCKFGEVKVEDMEEAIKFYTNFNKFMEESKTTVWKTLLTLGVSGLMIVIMLGIAVSIASKAKPYL